MIQLALSPLGRVMLLVGGLLLWTTYQRHDAARAAEAELALEYQRVTTEEVARQTGEAKAAATAAQARAVSAEAKARELQEIANGLTTELSESGATCPIPDHLRKRLLAIH